MAASKPTFQLSMLLNTICSLTLSYYLGTLTLVWFFSLWTSSLPRCPHCPASTTDTHSEFDSMPKTFASKHAISALPHAPSLLRSACEQFREEPAIAGLDWSFAPIPGHPNDLHISTGSGLHPSSERLPPCPGIDRPASGIQPLTSGRAPCPSLALRAIGFPTASYLRT